MMPPLPFNPFPELPVYAIDERTFIYDDRSVDYEALRKQAAEREAAERAASGPMLAQEMQPTPNVPILSPSGCSTQVPPRL